MGKGSIFVIIYSVFLLALFACFCYLMTTINPDPIVQSNKSDSGKLIGHKFSNYDYGMIMPDPENVNLRFGLEKAPEGNPNIATNFFKTDSITTEVPTIPTLSNRKSMGGPVIYIRTSTPRNIYTMGSTVMPMGFINRVQHQPTQNSTGLNLSLSHPTMKTRSIDYKANESMKTKKDDDVNRINEIKLDLNNSNTTNESKNYVNIGKSGRNNTKVTNNFGLLNVILETTSHEAEYIVIRDVEYFEKRNESFVLPVNAEEKKNTSQHLFDNKFKSSAEIVNNIMTKRFNDYRSETKIVRPHYVIASN